MTANGEVRIHRKNAVVGGCKGVHDPNRPKKGANRFIHSLQDINFFPATWIRNEYLNNSYIQSRVILKLISKSIFPAPITTMCDFSLMLDYLSNPKYHRSIFQTFNLSTGPLDPVHKNLLVPTC